MRFFRACAGQDDPSSAWNWLETSMRDADGGQLFALLQRYSLAGAGRRLLASLHHQANQAALDLLSTALCGDSHFPGT
jgi:hypothetical protein